VAIDATKRVELDGAVRRCVGTVHSEAQFLGFTGWTTMST